MKTRFFVLMAVIIAWSAVSAKHSDDFAIGNYSYWRYYNPVTMLDFMQTCGYNSSIVQLRNEDETATNLPSVTNMFNALNSRNIDAIVIDKSWDALQTNSKFGTHGLTLSNDQKYEAEYCSESDVVANDHSND